MIKVLKAGLYDTIQDLGRYDYQEFGVPISGVMDSYSAKLANALVGNDENAAVLEITLFGPKLEFQQNCLICIAGADLLPCLNGSPFSLHTAVFVKTGDVLSFRRRQYGCRAYLAVSGGFQTDCVMRSRSMYKSITKAIKIEKGDVLPVLKSSFDTKENSNASLKVDKAHFTTETLEVYKGPEFDLLTKAQQDILWSATFTVAKENSRMAYQLAEVLKNKLEPIITSLVLPGTVQLTPSGKLIVLMLDCQTTGGYPRVLQLSKAAMNILSQKTTNDRIKFLLVESY